METNVALARFFRTLAAASNQLASDLTDRSKEPSAVLDGQPLSLLVRGERQQAILTLPGLNQMGGMPASEIAREANYPNVPNVNYALRALEKRSIVELVPNREPNHWRLTERYRTPLEA